jgi:hypothetical protein
MFGFQTGYNTDGYLCCFAAEDDGNGVGHFDGRDSDDENLVLRGERL